MRGELDVDRDRAAIAMPSAKSGLRAETPDPRSGVIAAHVLSVAGAVSLGDQHRNRLSNELVRCVAETPHAIVREHNVSRRIDDQRDIRKDSKYLVRRFAHSFSRRMQ